MDCDFLKLYFSRQKDRFFNKQLEKGFSDALKPEILEYVKQILSVPLEDYIQYLKCNPQNQYISTEHITQTSRIELCQEKMCLAFQRAMYKPLNLPEIGKLLHNDNKERTRGTEAKFGENVKGASQFGLAYRLEDGKWSLSCFGFVYLDLSRDDQIALMSRTLLREPLYSMIFVDATNRSVSVADYMSCLSEATIRRRTPNVLAFCRIIQSQSIREGKLLLNQISK